MSTTRHRREEESNNPTTAPRRSSKTARTLLLILSLTTSSPPSRSSSSYPGAAEAFSFRTAGIGGRTTTPRSFRSHPLHALPSPDRDTPPPLPTATATTPDLLHQTRHRITTTALLVTICASLLAPLSTTVQSADAYESTDYASDAVTEAVRSLTESRGDNAGTMRAFTNIAEIITEGKGVGGEQSYSGVNLQRGFVADEDTAIYNPGLSILTESEKERLLDAVLSSRSSNKSSKTWSDDAEFAYSFLKTRFDPLHMTELRGSLGLLPFWGGALYLGSLAVQQFVRDSFEFVYVVCAAGVFLPVVVLVLLGS